jgi:hypothetical protein
VENEGKKKILFMLNNIYFHDLKKTGPLVETRRPLRLLDMRLFNCLSCAEITACNKKNFSKDLPEIFLFRTLNPIVKRTYVMQSGQTNQFSRDSIMAAPYYYIIKHSLYCVSG